jgi:hypothetical protein
MIRPWKVFLSVAVGAAMTPGAALAQAPTLNLDLGSPTAFSAFVPGVTQDYTSTLTADVFSTAANATLTVHDAGTTNVGKMANGAYALPQAVQAGAVKNVAATDTVPAHTVPAAPVFAPLGGTAAPTTLLTYDAPVHQTATITFRQSVAATDALRTGSYSKTLTFTLSTTSP